MPLVLTRQSRRAAWVALALLVLLPIAALAAEIRILRPFAPQSALGLAIAYQVRRLGPAAALVALAGVALLAGLLWGGTRRWWLKLGLGAALLAAAATAWVARLNPMELMYKPVPGRAFVAAAQAASFVADDDMVLAVQSPGSTPGADEAAYPVRELAYHHLVEDMVGERPVVVTY